MPAFRVRLRLRPQSRLSLLLRLLLLSAANIVFYTIFSIVQTLIFDIICFAQAMPPIKRPRAARPSTRAAKKSPPAGQLPEADFRAERTSTPNSGLINLNMEALAASISVAVKEAVQSAVTSTSTSADTPIIGCKHRTSVRNRGLPGYRVRGVRYHVFCRSGSY